jgi:hypothetical protein
MPLRRPFTGSFFPFAALSVAGTSFSYDGRLQRAEPFKGGVVGILVHGDNHFIVRGRQPDRETALALVRRWSLIQIAAVSDPSLAQWSITTREFRENLQWAVMVPADSEVSPAVEQLLSELRARWIEIQTWR